MSDEDADDGGGRSDKSGGFFVHHEFPDSKWALPLGFVNGLFYFVDAGWGREEEREDKLMAVAAYNGPSTSTPRQCKVDPRLFDPFFYCPTRLWSTPTTRRLPSTTSSTLMSTYGDEPISSFHRAVLSPCRRYFFTIGKHYAGGRKTYHTDHSNEAEANVSWLGYDLCLLKISVADGSMRKYVCKGNSC
jgi:hypothetical protein